MTHLPNDARTGKRSCFQCRPWMVVFGALVLDVASETLACDGGTAYEETPRSSGSGGSVYGATQVARVRRGVVTQCRSYSRFTAVSRHTWQRRTCS